MICDFSRYELDLLKKACELTLSQFDRSPVLLGVQGAIDQQMADLYNAIVDGMGLRCLDNAQGEQLDVIGRIIGQLRILENFAEKPWFTFDADNLGYSQSLAYVENAPLGGDLPADDEQYRQLIKAKIFRNHVKYGSIPEMLEFVRLIYGYNISIQNLGLSDLALIVPDTMPAYILQNLLSYDDTPQSQRVYFMPMPTTGRFTKVIHRPQPPFVFDRFEHGYSQGKSAVEGDVFNG